MSWRNNYNILVTDGQNLGSIAVVRSLGKKGYRVHVSSSDHTALAFKSRFRAADVVSPRYSDPAFVDWLRHYVATESVCCIIPSEDFLHAIRSHYEEFAPVLPVPEQENTLYSGLSKVDVYQMLLAGNKHKARLPPSICLRDADQLPTDGDLTRLGLPLFIKADATHSKYGEPSRTHRTTSSSEARMLATELLDRYSRLLIQGYVPGTGAGVFVLRWDDECVVSFAHKRLHEVPYTGGVSSLRESMNDEGLMTDGISKMNELHWRGVGMMEYRVDPTSNQFFFIEFNGRFWGSLHLALYAGVDFPSLLVDTFLKRPSPPSTRFPEGLRCRHLPMELQYGRSRLTSPAVSSKDKIWTLFEFVILTLDPRIRSDLWFPGDRMLFVRAMWRFLRGLGETVLKRMRG